ncbi:hypothetical protein [Pantanalinema sp. GBBB05]|uniref:hypothetical protein n=1 Tax=Pantanalinema sp. GBBB05 TaxID=2604139 RepID=UPI001D6F69BF|nr:hypothetical protein [Pantanalinema sp. GBBB05]
MAARLFLLLVIAGGLVGFAIQNWSPTIALTFLGIKTMALPLALWVLWAIAIGIVTTLVINALFAASNYLAVQAFRNQLRRNARASESQTYETGRGSGSTYSTTATSRTSTSANPDASWRSWRRDPTEREQRPPASPRDQSAARDKLDELMDELDDWETPTSDDWETNPREDRSDRQNRETAGSKGRDYEKSQVPRATSQSGSVYSYGYREPQNSGVGQTEDVQQPERVVDAEYRVIIPPYYPTEPERSPDVPASPPAEENADDWFEDDKPDQDNFGDPPSSHP